MNSKKKGSRGEREVSILLKDHGFLESRRGVQYQGSPESPDVVGLPGFHVEVKFLASGLNVYNSLKQAELDAGDEDIPVVFYRKVSKVNRSLPWTVTLYAHDFVNLVKGT